MAGTVNAGPEPARWLLRRLALAFLVVWGATSLTFAGMHLIPGDPARAISGGIAGTTSPEVLDVIRAEYGFDDPVWVQYLRFLCRLARLDLGTSYQLNTPVVSVIESQIGPTVTVAVGGLVLGVLLAVGAAVLTAQRPRPRAIARVAEFVALAMPSYWVAFLLLALFSFHWQLFPVIGDDGIGSYVLPWITLAVAIAGVLTPITRDSLEDALAQPFTMTVRARGATELRVRLGHGLRHTAPPVLTIAGWITGNLVGGIVVVETVFARPGLGQALVTAVRSRDYPVVTGVVVLVAGAFSVIGILVDVLSRAADPRIRHTVR